MKEKFTLKNVRVLSVFLFCLITFNCSGEKYENKPEFEIIRFDKDLYQYLKNEESVDIFEKYSVFLKEYGEKIIYIGKPDSLGFESRLKKFFSEPTLMSLYENEQVKFQDISYIREELSIALSLFFDNFPGIKKPSVYMHVSGLNQNVIVTDEILSISVDKYLGADYPLYQDFFYDYQRQLMSSDRIVPDYLLGFMFANMSFVGNQEILLDRILYEGKIRYILSQLLPERNTWEYVGYNKEQYDWCLTYEDRIWKSILENQHLFQPDYKATQQYMRDAPYTASLPSESPGKVGVWLGYRIIASYMKNNPNTLLSELISLTDYQKLLKESKYMPSK